MSRGVGTCGESVFVAIDGGDGGAGGVAGRFAIPSCARPVAWLGVGGSGCEWSASASLAMRRSLDAEHTPEDEQEQEQEIEREEEEEGEKFLELGYSRDSEAAPRACLLPPSAAGHITITHTGWPSEEPLEPCP